MKKKLVMGMCLAMLCILGAQAVWAEDEETNPNRLAGKFGILGNLGYSTYAMGSINDGMSSREFGYHVLGFSTSKTYVDAGLSVNGGAQYALLDFLAVGVEGGMLMPSTGKFTAKGSLTGWDHTDLVDEYNLPGTEFGVFAKALLPVGSRLLLNAQVGAGLVTLMGKIKSTDNYYNRTREYTLSGSTTGIKAQVGAELFLAKFLSLGVDLGIRDAKITSVTSKDSDGNSVTLDGSVDYSGYYGQGGIRVYF